MILGLLPLLWGGFSWSPPCESPESVGQGEPLLCQVSEPTRVETPFFAVNLEPGIRYGLCEDGGCLHARASEGEPWFSIDVRRGALQGQLAGVVSHRELAEKLSGERRPCETTGVEGREWVWCRFDYSGQLAEERVMEGDYYRIVGDDRWLAFSYRLSRGETFDRDAGRYRRMLFSLVPVEGYRPRD